MTKFRKIAATAVATAALMAGFAASAQAHITLGQIWPASQGGVACEEKSDLLQFGIHNGDTYVVPETGVLTSWSTNAAGIAGQAMGFKVFRESGSGYTVVAHDAPHPLSLGVNTFKVQIPVKVHDIIGLNSGNASAAAPVACAFVGFEAGSQDDNLYLYDGDTADGGTLPANKGENREFRANVSATLLERPEINIFGKVALGSITGGGKVVLKGNHFEEVSSVAFGGVAAKGFTVENEHQLTAIAPPGTTLAEIAATVTTPAGTATAPSHFYYSGCVVPKLKNKKLAAAKAKIKAAGCAVGKVKRVRGSRRKRGKVVQQSPKPGKVAAPGTKVSLKVGR